MQQSKNKVNWVITKERMTKEKQTPVIVALTGASGVQYALRLMQCLLDAGTPVYLMVSKAAQIVLSMETELKVPAKPAEMARYFTKLYNAKAGQLEVFGQPCR